MKALLVSSQSGKSPKIVASGTYSEIVKKLKTFKTSKDIPKDANELSIFDTKRGKTRSVTGAQLDQRAARAEAIKPKPEKVEKPKKPSK